MSTDLHLEGLVTIPAGDLSWTSVRSSGPGGQNVNKVSSKVDLRFDLEGTEALSAAVKARLRVLAAGRLDAEGRIVIVSQATRNRQDNLEDARARLAELIRQAWRPPKRRRPTKPSRAAKARRMNEKRQQGDKKRARAKISGD